MDEQLLELEKMAVVKTEDGYIVEYYDNPDDRNEVTFASMFNTTAELHSLIHLLCSQWPSCFEITEEK